MKWNFTTCASALALLVAIGCSKSDQAPRAEGGAAVSQSDSDKRPGDDADVSYNERSDFVSKMKSQLNEANREIEKLSNRIAEKADNAGSEAKAKLERLKEKSKNLDVEIERVENATESTWNEIKASSKKAYNDAKDAFRDARDWAAQKLDSK